MLRNLRPTARALLVVLPLLTGCKTHPHTTAAAQPAIHSAGTTPAASSPWQGNWGEFHKTPDGKTHAGAALVIRDCAGDRCAYQLMVTGPGINGGGKGTLQIVSATDATLRMDDTFDGSVCTLHALHSTTPDRIQLEPAPGGCSPFVTPGTTLAHTFALHNRAPVVDPDLVGCFLATDPARVAVCTHKDLSADQTAWERQADKTDTLQHPGDRGELERIGAAKSAILQACESAANVPGCLHDGFTTSGTALNRQHSGSIDSLLAAGDPEKGRAEAVRIAGTYRSHFANGDVSGEHYRSTDTLKIAPRPDGGIDYDTHLEFYNGHECNLNGTATYAKNGMFVDRQKQDSGTAPLCTFQIEPGKDGITFHDPDGACRELNCGMRGSFEGSTFSLKDRTANARTTAK